jgi:hypothetical protein
MYNSGTLNCGVPWASHAHVEHQNVVHHGEATCTGKPRAQISLDPSRQRGPMPIFPHKQKADRRAIARAINVDTSLHLAFCSGTNHPTTCMHPCTFQHMRQKANRWRAQSIIARHLVFCTAIDMEGAATSADIGSVGGGYLYQPCASLSPHPRPSVSAENHLQIVVVVFFDMPKLLTWFKKALNNNETGSSSGNCRRQSTPLPPPCLTYNLMSPRGGFRRPAGCCRRGGCTTSTPA